MLFDGTGLNSTSENNINSTLAHLSVEQIQGQNSNLHGLTTKGVQCLLQTWNASSLAGPHCSTYWDKLHCWPATPTGHNVTLACNDAFVNLENSRHRKRMIGNITRFCLQNETWYWDESSNYTSCHFAPESLKYDAWSIKDLIRYTLFIGSISSLLFLTVALYLFCRLKSIRCTRITIHIHFMAALATKCCVLILISDPTSFSDKYYYRDVDWICKLVIIIQLYSYLASINWMLIQGHYLNSKLSTDVFQKYQRLKFYYLFGWGLPLLLVIIWLITMETHHSIPCWRNYSQSNIIWIVAGPMFTALLINVAFLVNIVRVLVRKTRLTSNLAESEQFRRASKATAALFPLLGINNLIFFFNPGGNWVAIYMMTNAILQPLQGIMVSILYCFICRDVRDCVRREYWKFSLRHNFNSSVRFHPGRAFLSGRRNIRWNSSDRAQSHCPHEETFHL